MVPSNIAHYQISNKEVKFLYVLGSKVKLGNKIKYIMYYLYSLVSPK